MKVKLGQAVKRFFGNSSLEMVYFEAVANALDAKATEVEIKIKANALNQSETLEIEIHDNGIGFTDDRYEKFSNLFDVDESSHQGLGRLVYLCYFEKIDVVSFYEKTKKRIFTFSESFDEKKFEVSDVSECNSGTTFKMTGYSLQKIAKNEFVQPKNLKKRILEEFYAKFFRLKKDGYRIQIKIDADIDCQLSSTMLTNSEIPDFTDVELKSTISSIDKFYLYYSIETVLGQQEPSLVAAIAVDNRTFKVDIIAEENIPFGYQMVFLLYSDYFTGKVDLSRQNLTISKSELNEIQHLFRKEVVALIEETVPQIKIRNDNMKKSLVSRYPHLGGYFDIAGVGYASRNEVIKRAQDEFFKAQKEVLDATSLSEEQYKKSIDLSSRALTEYILFRQLTIDKLKKVDHNDAEKTIHDLIVPQGRIFKETEISNELYLNNSWILDDKYMTYKTVLSNEQMSKLIDFITEGEQHEKDADKPDISFIFSNDPTEEQKVDVVIIELKKKGITSELSMVAQTQLQLRADKLMKYYNNRIQRIWFYGIIEFTPELERLLRPDYTELYSTGKMYYRQTKAFVQPISGGPEIIVPYGIFMLNIDSVIHDADARNATFLKLIKSKFTNTTID